MFSALGNMANLGAAGAELLVTRQKMNYALFALFWTVVVCSMLSVFLMFGTSDGGMLQNYMSPDGFDTLKAVLHNGAVIVGLLAVVSLGFSVHYYYKAKEIADSMKNAATNVATDAATNFATSAATNLMGNDGNGDGNGPEEVTGGLTNPFYMAN